MFDYDKKLSPEKLCECFIRDGCLVSDGVDIFRQDGEIYHRIPAEELPTELRKILSPQTRLVPSSYALTEITKRILQNPDIRIDTSACNTGIVQFRNGLYDVRSGELYPPGGEYRWAVVDADYKVDATIEDAPVFYDFVKSSLDYEYRPDKTTLLLQILGYALSDFVSAKKAFFFIGQPSSGKSVFLEFVQRLVGDDDVSQIPLSAIGTRFNMGQLRGKRLNICTELPEGKFPSIKDFKAITACDRVYGELKGKDGFSFYPKVKLLNAGNSLPIPAKCDGTLAVVDRMCVLLFRNSIPREEWNVNLVYDLLAERDAICSLAVQTLGDLAASNFEFTVPMDSKIFMRSYVDAYNPLDLFIRDSCDTGDENRYVSSVALWEAYCQFCHDNMFSVGISQQVFVQKIESLVRVRKKRIRDGGRQVTVFYGIAIRSDLDAAGA